MGTQVSKCLYPSQVWRYDSPGSQEGRMVPYDLYEDSVRRHKVGDVITHEVAAPGIGRVQYRVTRIDSSGVWAAEVSNTSRELTAADVI